jgi:hypothetical protein
MDWLDKFEKIHQIWSSAASIIPRYFEQQLSPKMKDNEPMTLGQQLSPEETQHIWQVQQDSGLRRVNPNGFLPITGRERSAIKEHRRPPWTVCLGLGKSARPQLPRILSTTPSE